MQRVAFVLAVSFTCTAHGRRVAYNPLSAPTGTPQLRTTPRNVHGRRVAYHLPASVDCRARGGHQEVASSPELPFPVDQNIRRTPVVHMSTKLEPVPVPKHEAYLKDVCGKEPPAGLASLVGLLVSRGETLVEPGKDKSLFPLLVPLTKDQKTGETTGLMLWPYDDEEMVQKLPVVRTDGKQVVMLADNAASFVAKAAVLADDDGAEDAGDLIALAEAAGISYESGSAKGSPGGATGYIIFKIGPNMPLYQDLARKNLKDPKEAELRTLVTCDRIEAVYNEWGASWIFQMRMMEHFPSRQPELRDKARQALLCPYWTLDDDLKEVAAVHLKSIEDLREECRIKLTGQLPPEELFLAGNVDGRSDAEKARDKAIAKLNLVVTSAHTETGETWEAARREVSEHLRDANMSKLADMVAME